MEVALGVGSSFGDEVEPNDSWNNSQVVEVGVTVNGDLDETFDIIDTYQITLDSRYTLSLYLYGPSDTDFDLYLYDIDLVEIRGSVSFSNNEDISRSLESGTYYIKVEAWRGSGIYQLAIQ